MTPFKMYPSNIAFTEWVSFSFIPVVLSSFYMAPVCSIAVHCGRVGRCVY